VNAAPSTVTSVTPTCAPSTIAANQTAACTAVVQGTNNPSQSVTWTASTGTISGSGTYAPPSSVTSTLSVAITATSVEDPTKNGTTTITVNPLVYVTSVTVTCSPNPITVNQTSSCTANVQGNGNFNGAVNWTASAGTINPSGLYTPPASVTTAIAVTVTGTSVQTSTKSGSFLITVNPAPSTITSVTPSCNPNVLQMPVDGYAPVPTSQCTAGVQGTGNFSSDVSWQATMGSIYGSLLATFTPTSVNVQTQVTITATSTQDPTKFGTTIVTVNPITINCPPGNQPSVVLMAPNFGDSQLWGYTCNVDTTTTKVVIYALTNQWYVQPYTASPFTDISSDGSWTSYTHPWDVLVVLLVNPANYSPAATEITNPALDSNVLAWTMFPPGQAYVNFGGYVWGIKMTGNEASDQFDPGPNFWSNDPSIITVLPDGSLYLQIGQVGGNWQSAEVYLTQSLGFGTYSVQIASRLDQLDQNTVAAPLFIYAAPGQEFDNEYSGLGGLIPTPYDAQVVVQPYTVPGNIVRYEQPPTSQFTSQIEWRSDHVTFTTWNGWATSPAPEDVIEQWTYTGANNFAPGSERARINLWLLNGMAPTNGIGDEMIIKSFTFQP
jgi:hypothetical protein